MPDLTEAEALAYLQLQTTAPPLRPSDARRLVALLGGRLAHLRRAVAGLGGGGATGVQGAYGDGIGMGLVSFLSLLWEGTPL